MLMILKITIVIEYTAQTFEKLEKNYAQCEVDSNILHLRRYVMIVTFVMNNGNVFLRIEI